MTRIGKQETGERGYHIFYQLTTPSALVTYPDFKLNLPENFKFLTVSDANVDDVKEFRGLLEAFNMMAFKREEEDEILRIAAGVLHMGNLEFSEDDDEAKVEDMAGGASNGAGSIEERDRCPQRRASRKQDQHGFTLPDRPSCTAWRPTPCKGEDIDTTKNRRDTLIKQNALRAMLMRARVENHKEPVEEAVKACKEGSLDNSVHISDCIQIVRGS